MSRALKLKPHAMPEPESPLRGVDAFASPSVDAYASPGTDAYASRTDSSYIPSHSEHTFASHAILRTTTQAVSQNEENYQEPGRSVTGSHIAYTPRARHNPSRRENTRELKLVGNPSNIWFNWNGHSWCAFEVLGVPSASSVALSQEAFRKAVATTASESHAFLNEAIQAIERCCK